MIYDYNCFWVIIIILLTFFEFFLFFVEIKSTKKVFAGAEVAAAWNQFTTIVCGCKPHSHVVVIELTVQCTLFICFFGGIIAASGVWSRGGSAVVNAHLPAYGVKYAVLGVVQ